MNPSGPDPYEELATAFIEGELASDSAASLEEMLRQSPDRAQTWP